MVDDILFDIQKDYYLGNYQSCINKANSFASTRESTFYMCLSYFHLKKYDILNLEVSKSTELCVKMIGILVDYTENLSERSSIMQKLNHMLDDKLIDPKDDLSRVVVSSIFTKEKDYSNSLKVLHQLDTLPSLFAQINIFILMNRIDLAERQLRLMQTKDDYATLTLLATAQVRLSTFEFREAHDIAKELEDKYQATPLLKNIQTAAAILMGDYEDALQYCETSLEMDKDNLEAMINMIHILSKSKASSEVKDRHYERLKILHPNNEFVKEVERLEVELA